MSYRMENPPQKPDDLAEYLYREFSKIQESIMATDISVESRWRTLFFPAVSMSRPTSPAPAVPGVILSADTGQPQVMWFSSTVENSLYGALQLPPDYKQGSLIYPEVTWLNQATATAGAVVIWRFEYSMAERSGTFASALRLAKTATAGAPYAHLSAEFPAITASSIGTQILYRLWRDISDTLDQSAGATALVVHYEADAHGSIYRNIKG